MRETVVAIIVAAGSSSRIGTDKIFLQLVDKPVLAWSVDTCQNNPSISRIVLVMNKNNVKSGEELRRERNWNKVTAVCIGGVRRQDSVKQGLKNVENCQWVLIQDGARPFITDDLITNGLEAAKKTGAAIAAVPVKDTIKLGDKNNIVKKTLQRDSLWAVQTPQIFRSDIISNAYNDNTEDVTDDASLVEKCGYKVKIYMGSYKNIKITTTEDLNLARFIAGGGEY